MIPQEWLEQARQRIAPHIVETPLTCDPQRGLYLKWENHQVTGSFKARGALNKVLSLEDWEREAGLATASAGNHGQGVALAARLTGSHVDVFVPAHAVPSKVESMRELGARVHLVDGGYAEAEAAGRQFANEQKKVFVSPYNDGQVIAGQGTIALEVLRQLPSVTGKSAMPSEDVVTWIVPIGGAGLISGCGAALAGERPKPRLIGVQPAASAFTYTLFHEHTQIGVEDNPTLADGLSGAIEEDSVTIPMLREMVDDVMVVSEEAIAQAIAFAWHAYHEKIEGSAAAALALVLTGQITTHPCVVILTGGNIQQEVFDDIVRSHAEQAWT